MLDLGPGAADISGRMADRGHTVVGVEISPVRVRYAQEQVNRPRATGSLTIVEGDFYTVELEGRFDVVCHWGGFGIGSDADQRRLLRRSAYEWLAPGGCMLMDVYSPVPFTSALEVHWRSRALSSVGLSKRDFGGPNDSVSYTP